MRKRNNSVIFHHTLFVTITVATLCLATRIGWASFGFTPPVQMNSNAIIDSGLDWSPQVGSDGTGTWMAVWTSGDTIGGTAGSDLDIVVSTSVDSGVTWTSPAAIDTASVPANTKDDWDPQLAFGSGVWAVVWTSEQDVLGIGANTQEIGSDLDILVSTSSDGGSTWSLPEAVNDDAGQDNTRDEHPRIATDGGGNWVVVWERQDVTDGDRDIFYSRSTDNTLTWRSPKPLNVTASVDGTSDDTTPYIASDGAGQWIAVWSSNFNLDNIAGTDKDIFVARATGSASEWTYPELVDVALEGADTGDDWAPTVAGDGAGNWVVVWHSEENMNDSVLGYVGMDRDIFQAFSSDNGETWTPAAALNTYAADDSSDDYMAQVVHGDFNNNWVVVWHTDESLGNTYNDGTCTYKDIGWDDDIMWTESDDGQTWSCPQPLNSNADSDTGDDEFPSVATDGNGVWITVWDSAENLVGTPQVDVGTDQDIFTAVLDETDSPTDWGNVNALNTTAATDWGDDEVPSVTTDAHGNWVTAWESNYPIDPSTGSPGTFLNSDYDVFRSGLTIWSEPVALNSNAATDTGDDGSHPTPPSTDELGVQTATDGAGTWLAVWQSTDDLGGTINTDYDILWSVSTDDGVTWTAPAALNTDADVDTVDDEFPYIAPGGGGVWIVVWERLDDHLPVGKGPEDDLDIYFSRTLDNGATWSAAGPLNSTSVSDTGDDLAPKLSTDGTGNWITVWTSDQDIVTPGANTPELGTDWDILVSTSPDNGVSWTPAAALNADAKTDATDGVHGQDNQPYITTDSNGLWVTVWTSDYHLASIGANTVEIGADKDIFISKSRNNGNSWTAPAALNQNANVDDETGGQDEMPRIATDMNGNWVAAWQSYDDLSGTIGTDADILTAVSSDNTHTWTGPARVNADAVTDSTDDFAPDIVTDKSGRWLLTWHTDNSLDSTVGTDFDIFESQSWNNGRTWTASVPLVGSAISDSGSDIYPSVATDGLGHWITAWQSNENVTDPGLGSIGTDYDVLISRTIDRWTQSATLNSRASVDGMVQHDYDVQMATDGAGNWVAVWTSEDPQVADGTIVGTDPDILYSVSLDDRATWSPQMPVDSEAATDGDLWDGFPSLVADKNGNWIAVWTSEKVSGDTDIDYSVLSGADGTWSATASIDDSDASAWSPRLATGDGVWIVIWESKENLGTDVPSDYDIRVSVSDDVGATWTSPKYLNTNADDDGLADDYVGGLATNSDDNWVVVWYSNVETISTNTDIDLGPDFDILVSTSDDNGESWNPPKPLDLDPDNGMAVDDAQDRTPQIVSDGHENWIVVWSSNNDLARTSTAVGPIGDDFDILMCRSLDDGDSWTAPAPVNTNAVTDTGWDGLPKITSNGAGRWMVSWQSDDPLDNTIGQDYDILYSVGRFMDNQDTDGDGLADIEEENVWNTDPNNADTDRDGIEDMTETAIYGTDPLNPDTDGDGLADGSEVDVLGTNPLDLDTDGDGLDDYQEMTSFNTKPTLADTDGDGYSDGDEADNGISPLNSAKTPSDNDADFVSDLNDPDDDNDGLLDTVETDTGIYVSSTDTGSSPWKADTDGDGLSDGDEITIYGTNPVKADTDGDGISDGEDPDPVPVRLTAEGTPISSWPTAILLALTGAWFARRRFV